MIKEGIYVSALTVMTLWGMIMIMGYLLAQIEKWNNKYIQKAFGWGGIVLTGCIGTVLHEFSHFIMCILFRHKIKQVKFFRPIQSKKDGVLGYVSHGYNPNSLYQKVGNFFIGIAPVIVGTVVIVWSMKICQPDSYQILFRLIKQLSSSGHYAIIDDNEKIVKGVLKWVESLWSKPNLRMYPFYINLVVMYSISTHMSLSKEDLKGAWSGGILLVILLSLFEMVFYCYNPSLCLIISHTMVLYLGLFLGIGILFALITLCISLMIYGLKRLIQM